MSFKRLKEILGITKPDDSKVETETLIQSQHRMVRMFDILPPEDFKKMVDIIQSTDSREECEKKMKEDFIKTRLDRYRKNLNLDFPEGINEIDVYTEIVLDLALETISNQEKIMSAINLETTPDGKRHCFVIQDVGSFKIYQDPAFEKQIGEVEFTDKDASDEKKIREMFIEDFCDKHNIAPHFYDERILH